MKKKKDLLLADFKKFEVNETTFIIGGLQNAGGTSGCHTGDTYCGQDSSRIVDDCDCDEDTDSGPSPLPFAGMSTFGS